MEYTKGPWDKMGSNGIMSLSGTLVAIASADGVLDKETVQHNATLIAAAPELLEALINCERLLNNTDNLSEIGKQYHGKALAAIQKATL